MLFFSKKYDKAVKILKEFCKNNQKDIEAHISLSIIYSNYCGIPDDFMIMLSLRIIIY